MRRTRPECHLGQTSRDRCGRRHPLRRIRTRIRRGPGSSLDRRCAQPPRASGCRSDAECSRCRTPSPSPLPSGGSRTPRCGRSCPSATRRGIGETSSGSDHPNHTQPQSHPAATPSTDLLPSQVSARSRHQGQQPLNQHLRLHHYMRRAIPPISTTRRHPRAQGARQIQFTRASRRRGRTPLSDASDARGCRRQSRSRPEASRPIHP